ncbi:MAG: hypothetical protein U9O94_09425 [Nanoarchaeota archaeon]|nr:hypothetical protein [Nanoarchaeota archaeon]
MVNRFKIHRIVEYIKLFGFEFETYDVIESLDGVLTFYNVFDHISDEEYYFLIDELLLLAEQFEFSEVDHLASQDDPLITGIKENNLDLRTQTIERKLARAGSHISQDDFLQNLALT